MTTAKKTTTTAKKPQVKKVEDKAEVIEAEVVEHEAPEPVQSFDEYMASRVMDKKSNIITCPVRNIRTGKMVDLLVTTPTYNDLTSDLELYKLYFNRSKAIGFEVGMDEDEQQEALNKYIENLENSPALQIENLKFFTRLFAVVMVAPNGNKLFRKDPALVDMIMEEFDSKEILQASQKIFSKMGSDMELEEKN